MQVLEEITYFLQVEEDGISILFCKYRMRVHTPCKGAKEKTA